MQNAHVIAPRTLVKLSVVVLVKLLPEMRALSSISEVSVLLTFEIVSAGDTEIISLLASKPFWMGNRVNVLLAQDAYNNAFPDTVESAAEPALPPLNVGLIANEFGVVPVILVSACV